VTGARNSPTSANIRRLARVRPFGFAPPMPETPITCPKCGAEIPRTEAIAHTAMLAGGIQGIAGREALPEIKTLALDGGA
jgi:hypothetical protein